MSKKTFSGGINSLLGEPSEKPKAGKPEEAIRKPSGGSGGIRTTLILQRELLEKVKAMAYWDRTTIKEIVASALEETIRKHETKRGNIYPPLPKK
jgi:predicted DNA-binding ribbon-helix-helix protein